MSKNNRLGLLRGAAGASPGVKELGLTPAVALGGQAPVLDARTNLLIGRVCPSLSAGPPSRSPNFP